MTHKQFSYGQMKGCKGGVEFSPVNEGSSDCSGLDLRGCIDMLVCL